MRDKEVAAEDESTESVYEQLFSAVVNASDGTRSLCEAFKVLPLKSVCSPIIFSLNMAH